VARMTTAKDGLPEKRSHGSNENHMRCKRGLKVKLKKEWTLEKMGVVLIMVALRAPEISPRRKRRPGLCHLSYRSPQTPSCAPQVKGRCISNQYTLYIPRCRTYAKQASDIPATRTPLQTSRELSAACVLQRKGSPAGRNGWIDLEQVAAEFSVNGGGSVAVKIIAQPLIYARGIRVRVRQVWVRRRIFRTREYPGPVARVQGWKTGPGETRPSQRFKDQE
jgi:hypothetical protein